MGYKNYPLTPSTNVEAFLPTLDIFTNLKRNLTIFYPHHLAFFLTLILHPPKNFGRAYDVNQGPSYLSTLKPKYSNLI